MVVRDEECGAIGRSTLQRVRGDLPTRARSILNDNRGAKLILQLLGERARDSVGTAARREAHQNANSLARLGERCSANRREKNAGKDQANDAHENSGVHTTLAYQANQCFYEEANRISVCAYAGAVGSCMKYT